MQQLAVGGAAYIGSGAWLYTETLQKATVVGSFQLKGIGDLINMMITASLAVLALKYLGDKFGSLTIILLPIVIGTGVGYIGWKLLPYVSYVSTLIGQIINSFTSLQPILMSILIAMAFALLIVSPISTVAIGLAIGLNGMAAGAASSGFGLVGAVGPIASLAGGSSIVIIILAWVLIPFGIAFVSHKLCKDVLKLYTDAIFVFEG